MQEIRVEDMKEKDTYGVLFREKLQAEWMGFLRRMLKKSKEDLIQNADKICTYRKIYQIMSDESHFMDAAQLNALIVFPGVLGYLFCRWLRQEDAEDEALENCLRSVVLELEKEHSGLQEKGGAA